MIAVIETVNSVYEFESENGTTGILRGGRLDTFEGVTATLMTDLAVGERPVFIVDEDCFLVYDTNIGMVKAGGGIRISTVKEIREK